jgi:hypothetical protein
MYKSTGKGKPNPVPGQKIKTFLKLKNKMTVL